MIKMVVDMPLEKACHMFQAASNIKSELGHIVQINNTIERLRIRGFESKAASNDEFESFIKFYLCWATSLMYVKLDKSQWMGIESVNIIHL
ncbi:hypothetical protein FB639_000246 [Coemansia asiatica]|nr:hypothetical protein FB639_000246 [Coemansia asiatica]